MLIYVFRFNAPSLQLFVLFENPLFLEISVLEYRTMYHQFNEILAFINVVETGSISSAALRMHLSKSVISQRISKLENRLKVKLFHRSTRGVIVTDPGNIFYQRALVIVQQLDQISEELTEKDNMLCGLLRIAAPMTFGTKYLGPFLFDFMNRHPRLSLSLELNDQITDLSGEGYDLGIRIGRLRDSSLVARKLAVSKRVICCSPAYAQNTGLPSSIEQLTEHSCIGYSNVTSSQIWQFEPKESGNGPQFVVVRSRITTNNGESIRDAAIAGLGIAILPEFIATEALAEGQLIKVLPNTQPVADTIYAIYPKSRYTSNKVRAVVEHLITVFNENTDWKRI